VVLISGCGKPNAANIALRKENQALQEKIDRLEQARKSDAAAIRALEGSKGTLPTLPQDRLDLLFVPTELKIGRLTGGARSNPELPGDDSIKIYVVPIDQFGDELKSAGAFVVEVFDLNKPASPLVGRWEFSTVEARKHWYGSALLYEYVLPCPLKQPPLHDELTVKITFTDALTQRTLDAQKVVKLTLAPAAATQPAVQADR
jgi:hypothetical protein